MDYIKDKSILELTEKIKKDLITIRRDFHMHPELGMEEHRTSKIIGDMLEDLGIKVQRNVANTGVVGLLEGRTNGKTIALRADMDALPIQDVKNVEYASTISGKMHACGHDAHTTMLLGTAMILSKMRDKLIGNVLFIFQPAEETVGGADPMIKEGVLKNPKVDAIFGIHMAPDIDTGKIGVRYGVSNASANTFEIEIKGKATHGATPHLGVDAITVSAQVINALQTVISRQIDPIDNAVLTVGTIKGGTQSNIISDSVYMTGTLRTFAPGLREIITSKMKKLLEGITESMGANFILIINQGYPILSNHGEMVELVENAAKEIIGNENIITIQKPRLGAEDFAYFVQEVSGAFWRLGCKDPKSNIELSDHSSNFDIDEDSLTIGVAMHIKIVLNFLC